MEFLKYIIALLNKDFFNAIDNLSSLIGLLVSVFVLVKIKKIESNYNARIRLPALLAKINAHASNLIALMQDYAETVNEIKLELASTGADLESLHKKVDRSMKAEIKSTIRRIRRFDESQEKRDGLSKRRILLLYVGLSELDKAGYSELVGDKKRDEVYQIYQDIKILLVKVDNMQEDKMLE
jgi:hypothetical protein